MAPPDGTQDGTHPKERHGGNNSSSYGAITIESIRSVDGVVLVKTPSTFLNDLRQFVAGSVPHSLVVATSIGIVCGISAWIYYAMLEWALEFLWKTLPQKILPASFPSVLWIPIVGMTMAVCVGLTVVFFGEPGDLPYTIKCVHGQAYVAMDHVVPMVLASQFSILGGGSLGPEASLVAICAALGGFLSRKVFRITDRNLIRKHTLMGMAAALAGFFGVPLGGSLFALEVNSRFGIEYFEHTVEAIFCGEVCLLVFRALAGLAIAPIWHITEIKLESAEPVTILYGVLLGSIGAFTAWVFAMLHFKVMGAFKAFDLLDNRRAVQRSLIGGVVVVTFGVLIPQTMFWGEFEFQTISTLGPASGLAHIWPTSGSFGFEMNNFNSAMIVGLSKFVAISFTVAGGYRGGFIFPLFASGAALGRAIFFLCPFIPVQLCVLCMAAALNVAITRTTIATTLILAFLAGEQNAISAILASALVSLFLTAYMPFIKTQIARADLEHCLYTYSEDDEDTVDTVGLTPMIDEHKHFEV